MRRVAALLLLWLPCAGTVAGCGAPADEMTIGAAASLRHVMPSLVAAFREGRHDGPVAVTYAASGTLRRQVVGGAPIDGLVLAGAAPVDDLVARGLAVAGTRKVVARNEIVLIGPRDGRDLTFETLTDLPAGERLAIGDPSYVPVGRYAKAALERLGTWNALEARFVYAQDVSAVLTYVRSSVVVAGVVYRTETRGIDDIRLLDTARPPWAPQPEVVAVAVAGADHEERARAFLEFLVSPPGQAILASFGFRGP